MANWREQYFVRYGKSHLLLLLLWFYFVTMGLFTSKHKKYVQQHDSITGFRNNQSIAITIGFLLRSEIQVYTVLGQCPRQATASATAIEVVFR